MSIIGDGIMLGAGGETASIFVTGLSETDSVTATHKILKKVPNPASVVPDGYTQLEYIESAGTQYIDTGISVPHESSKVVVQFSTSNTTQDAPISGYAYSTWGWSTNMLYVSNKQKFGINGVVGPTVVAGTVYEVEYSNTYFKINGATTSATFTGYVDGYNNTVFYGNGKRGQYKLYFYKLYNGSLLVRDYVPAKRNSDGSVGLYDLVSNTFFGNSGTGTFVAGAEIPQYIDEYVDGKSIAGKWTQKPNPAFHGLPSGYTELESIEGTGTQYIQLPFTYDQIDTVKAKFEITDISYTSHTALVHCEGANTLKAFIQWFPVASGNFSKGWWDSYCGSYNTHTPEPVANLIYEAESVLKSGEQKLILNGVTSYSLTRTGTPNCPYPVRVMRAGNFETNTNCSKVKLYSISMFFENNEVCNLIPCKRNSDSTIGMYDLVTNAFFENAGTGTFIAGAEVPQTIDGFLIDKIKDYGTWTVTATDGTNTKTLDVLVDAANTFSVNIHYIYRYDDMVLWLDGTDFLDHSKNGLEMNRGTYPSLSATDFDKSETNCYLFDNNSTSTSLYTLSNPVMNMGGFSFSWWMKVSSKPSYSCCWYMSKDASVSGSYAIGCNTTIGTTGKYGVCARTSSGATADVTSTYVTPTNTSLHCVQTYDGTTMKLYVNGQLVWSASNSLGFSSVSVGRINIGHNMWNTSVERFMGYMTDIRLYNAVLTSDEILEMFETGTEIHS